MKKKRVYVDMDGVLCDYAGAYKRDIESNPTQIYPQSQFGFFLNLEPLENAIETFKMLEKHFDMWILTRPSVYNVMCYTEKAMWVKNHLGFDIQCKTIIACDKSLLKGDFLIDDTTQFGQTEFEGEFIHFGTDKFPDWKTIRNYLLTKV